MPPKLEIQASLTSKKKADHLNKQNNPELDSQYT